nr:glycine receptor subunit alpha-2-like isoform X2 [Onthophagus taurus]
MTVIDINSINVEDMDFRMDMFLRQQWQDSRLRIPEEVFEYGDEYVTLPSQFFDNLWQPDLYFLNSKVVEIATLNQKFSSVTLFRNKTVRYSARMHAIVACQMEFKFYPMDTQVCPLNIESFAYDNSKMILNWLNPGVVISPELKLLQYNVGKVRLEHKYVQTGEKNGNFSRLVVYFRFERQIGHHLIQTFAPSTLIVILSWFSFWLGLDAIPARVTLMVTCLLTLVTMFTALRSDIPPVAYIKSLDIWMAMCMFFVFSALGEFVIIKVLDEKYRMLKKQEFKELQISQWNEGVDKKYLPLEAKHGKFRLYWLNDRGEEVLLWVEIDKKARTVFPTLYLIFVSIYFPVLLIHSQPQT